MPFLLNDLNVRGHIFGTRLDLHLTFFPSNLCKFFSRQFFSRFIIVYRRVEQYATNDFSPILNPFNFGRILYSTCMHQNFTRNLKSDDKKKIMYF